MNDRLSPGLTSRSAAVKARLDYPVIDTDVHVNDYTPVLEDYVAAVRRRQAGRCAAQGAGRALRHPQRAARTGTSRPTTSASYYRTMRSPWWARVTRNTLDLATYTLPELLYERLAEQGSDYSVLFPNNVLSPAAAGGEFRQPLHRAHQPLPRRPVPPLSPTA